MLSDALSCLHTARRVATPRGARFAVVASIALSSVVLACNSGGCAGSGESVSGEPAVSAPVLTEQETERAVSAANEFTVYLPPITLHIDLGVLVELDPLAIRLVDLLIAIDLPPGLQWLEQPFVSMAWEVSARRVIVCVSAIGYKACYDNEAGLVPPAPVEDEPKEGTGRPLQGAGIGSGSVPI